MDRILKTARDDGQQQPAHVPPPLVSWPEVALGACCILGFLTLVVLCAGDPDVIDAIIHWLMRA